MGTLFRFECSGCGYRAEVCGGTDAGMEVELTTFTCTKCRKLMDLETARWAGNDAPASVIPHCRRGKSHPLIPWTAGGPCPRCHQPMSQGEVEVIWD